MLSLGKQSPDRKEFGISAYCQRFNLRKSGLLRHSNCSSFLLSREPWIFLFILKRPATVCDELISRIWNFFLVVQSLSHVHPFGTPWTAAWQISRSFTISPVWSDSCSLSQRCHTTISFSVAHFSSCLQSFPTSGSYTSESALSIKWPKYWSFSLSMGHSNEYSGLIPFRIEWFDLAVQGTLKSLLQHHSLKTPILRHSVFFIVQFSHHTWLLEEPWLWLHRHLSARFSSRIYQI